MSPPASAATRLADFALQLRHDEIPAPVVAAAKHHLLDALGCGLAAVALGEGGAGLAVAAAMSGAEEASLIGARERVPAPSAALANGMRIHALDFDDTHAESVAHVSAVIVPAALAVAESRSTGGRELLSALVAANELVARIGGAAPGEFHARGFHPTAIAGVFGAAAAAARLDGAQLETAVSALGIAGSMASGLFAYLDDATATKPIHAGWAAHAGLVAARLAAAGAQGPPHVLEGRFGLFEAFVGRVPDLDAAIADLGRRWRRPGSRTSPTRTVTSATARSARRRRSLPRRSGSPRSSRSSRQERSTSCSSRGSPNASRARRMRPSSACRTRSRRCSFMVAWES